MNKKTVIACHSILSSFTKDEVDKIVEVLNHYNKTCKEEHRAPCLLNGCANSDSPLEKEIAPYRDTTIVESFSKKAAASYSGPSTATCSKCGAPL